MPGTVISLIVEDCSLTEEQKKVILEKISKVLRGQAVEAVSATERDSSCVNAEFVSHCHDWK